MPPAIHAVFLNWSSARLVALILNALTGLVLYYDKHYAEINVDGLFGLRIIEGQLRRLYVDFDGRGLDGEIIAELRNLSFRASEIANRVLPLIADREPKFYRQFHYLLTHPYEITNPAQRTDERFRWMEKERPQREEIDERGMWFNESCFGEVLSKNYEVSAPSSTCSIDEHCLKRMLGTRGLTGYRITNQILFAAVIQMVPCSEVASRYLSSTWNQTLDDFIKEYCTNMIEELLSFQKNARILARMNYRKKDLLMEQVFACGQFGFVETSSLHLLVSVLSWQHPTLGCFTKEKPENLPNVDRAEVNTEEVWSHLQSRDLVSHLCSSHSATAAASALVVFLRFLFSPSPWPEFILADQPVTVHSIIAEDRFKQYKYARWVRESFPVQIRLSQPPHLGWSPDFLAYLLLLVGIVGCSIIAKLGCKRRSKRFYHFAYKKL